MMPAMKSSIGVLSVRPMQAPVSTRAGRGLLFEEMADFGVFTQFCTQSVTKAIERSPCLSRSNEGSPLVAAEEA
jgi:hypothetical protein